MNKKYELNENNINHDNDCCVYGDAKVYGDAQVCEDTWDYFNNDN